MNPSRGRAAKAVRLTLRTERRSAFAVPGTRSVVTKPVQSFGVFAPVRLHNGLQAQIRVIDGHPGPLRARPVVLRCVRDPNQGLIVDFSRL